MKFLRDLIHGIRNIIRYTPIIWHDQDWDNSNLLVLIKFKLRNIYKFNSSDKAQALHPKKELRRLLEIISHIEHYQDLDKFTKLI